MEEDEWVEIGIALMDKKEYQAALNVFNDALQINPDSVIALNNKAVALIHLRKYSEAKEILFDLIERDGIQRTYLVNLGVALSNLGNYNEAVACFDYALEDDPDDTFAQKEKDKVIGMMKEDNDYNPDTDMRLTNERWVKVFDAFDKMRPVKKK